MSPSREKGGQEVQREENNFIINYCASYFAKEIFKLTKFPNLFLVHLS